MHLPLPEPKESLRFQSGPARKSGPNPFQKDPPMKLTDRCVTEDICMLIPHPALSEILPFCFGGSETACQYLWLATAIHRSWNLGQLLDAMMTEAKAVGHSFTLKSCLVNVNWAVNHRKDAMSLEVGQLLITHYERWFKSQGKKTRKAA